LFLFFVGKTFSVFLFSDYHTQKKTRNCPFSLLDEYDVIYGKMTTKILRQIYNYRAPDVTQADPRDYVFGEAQINASAMTTNSSLSLYQLTGLRVESQSVLGSCTSQGSTTSFEDLVYLLTGDLTFQASAMFNYTQSRILDGTELTEDPGTTLRSAFGNMRLAGVCRDTTWAYTRANFSLTPSPEAYEEAAMLARMFTYFEVNRKQSVLKYIIGDLGYTVVIGFVVYPSFTTSAVDESGDIPMPSDTEIATGSDLGHVLTIVGWDDAKKVYIVMNSYGKDWGNGGGYGTLPYAYFENTDLTPEAKLMLPSEDFVQKYDRFKKFVLARQTPALVVNNPNSVKAEERDINVISWRNIFILLLVMLVMVCTWCICAFLMRITYFQASPAASDGSMSTSVVRNN
jgi:C1A family cysteine protease